MASIHDNFGPITGGRAVNRASNTPLVETNQSDSVDLMVSDDVMRALQGKLPCRLLKSRALRDVGRRTIRQLLSVQIIISTEIRGSSSGGLTRVLLVKKLGPGVRNSIVNRPSLP